MSRRAREEFQLTCRYYLMVIGGLALLAATFTAAPGTGEIRGVVLDANGGEPLARVQVELVNTPHQVVTDSQGRFSMAELPAGDYALNVATVGYRLLKRKLHLAEGERQDLEVILTPDNLRRTDSVEVKAGPFELPRPNSPSEINLSGVEAKNLASVLADDPLRAAQSLPGVSSNDDFDSRFSLRGADYSRIGLYLDDILLHAPFHTVAQESASGSMTAFNGDMLDSLSLHSSVFPARYGERTAGILDAETREGSRLAPSVRLMASASNAGVLWEGPLGKSRRGSWMAGARKSYLQYIIRRLAPDTGMAFGLNDMQGKLDYDLTRAHHLSLSLVEGFSDLNRTSALADLGGNSLMLSKYHLSLANLGWRYSPGSSVMLTNRLAYMREKFNNRNRDRLNLVAGHYGEWVWQASGTWIWGQSNTFDAGWSVRRIRDRGFSNLYQFNPFAVQVLEDASGNALRLGGYAEQSFNLASGKLLLSAGARWDRQDVDGVQAISPHAAISLAAGPSTQLRFGWGQYVQYPELQLLLAKAGSRSLLPARSTHYLFSVEQRLGERTRLRAEFYEREDRDLTARPFYEPRLIDGVVFNPPLNAPIRNSVRGYSRGFEVFLQKRTANRLSGWVSYSYGRARLRDGEARISYFADEDQRHTINIFGSWRVRPTVNLSLKGLYGSGYPLPGFFRLQDGVYYLAESRNTLRLGAFSRIDARLNKAYVFDRWKLTLYGEVINMLNQSNYRFDCFDGYYSQTGRAILTLGRMFPILPSIGVVLEF